MDSQAEISPHGSHLYTHTQLTTHTHTHKHTHTNTGRLSHSHTHTHTHTHTTYTHRQTHTHSSMPCSMISFCCLMTSYCSGWSGWEDGTLEDTVESMEVNLSLRASCS